MKNNRCQIGFTIVELLLALAITGMLLAAVAVAFNASVINYRENEKIFKTINNARQALLRMTSQLRTGYWVDPNAPSNECSFFTADGQDLTYEYRSADNKLYLITNSDDQEYVLCENVTSASFIKTATDDGLDCKSVQISMTVQSGDMQRTVSTAVVIRKNLM
jgi:prepilin-type N-terminal cleavage/methylation domain-containing protein